MKVLITVFLCALCFTSNAQLIVEKYESGTNELLSKTTSKNSYSWLILGVKTETLDDDEILGWEFDSDGEEIGSLHLTVQALELTEDYALYTVKSMDGETLKIVFYLNTVMVSIIDKDGLTIITGDVSY